MVIHVHVTYLLCVIKTIMCNNIEHSNWLVNGGLNFWDSSVKRLFNASNAVFNTDL